MRRPFRTLLAAALATSVTGATLASAATNGSKPQPAEPESANPLLVAQATVEFKTKQVTHHSPKDRVFFEVAASRSPDADGTLRPHTLPKRHSFLREMAWSASEKRFIYKLRYADYSAVTSFWLNTAGDYYWQPYRVNCADKHDSDPAAAAGDCAMAGHINAVKVVKGAQ